MLAQVCGFSVGPCSYQLSPVTGSWIGGISTFRRQTLAFTKSDGTPLKLKKFVHSLRSWSRGYSSRAHSLHSLVPISGLEDAKDGNGYAAPSFERLESSSYRLPPTDIRKIVDAPPTPDVSVSPQRDKILFLKRRSLPPVSDLARPEENIGGVRIDGSYNARSRLPFYTGIGIHTLMDDDTLGPEVEVFGFPDGAKINFVHWSLDGKYLSFSIRFDQEDNTSSKLSLWVANVETGQARLLTGTAEFNINAVFNNFVWIDDSTLVVCTIPSTRGEPPKKPVILLGPKIQSNKKENRVPVRTYQDFLEDEYDADLFDYYSTSQLLWVRLDGTTKPIGPPAVYISIDPSPDGKYLMVSSVHRPYSSAVPCEQFPQRTEIWTSDGKFVRELCDLPLAAEIPSAFNNVRKGRRSIHWRPDKSSSLYWAETQDGGDAKVKVSPRDIIYTQSAEPLTGEEPEVLHKLDLRYEGIYWSDDSLVLVYESWSWYKTRRTQTWIISPEKREQGSRVLFDRSLEDVYSDPGSPMLRRTSAGTYVLAKIRKADGGSLLLLKGTAPEGNVPFLELLDINTGEKERIWVCDKKTYRQEVVSLMSDQSDDDLDFDKLKILLLSKESKREKSQYFLQSWPDKRISQITNFPHPYPQLSKLRKETIRCQRKDGVQLTANLYLPPGYDASRDGPLPTLVWCCPEAFKSKTVAGRECGSFTSNEFAEIAPTSPLILLARGFAILSGPLNEVLGGVREANDRYVELLVASFVAVVDEVVRRGVAHRNKIAVGGHSYGAFMTANLLAHAPHLFCCGIARSGAYNRTLTPFGFQNEDRTLWEAAGTYFWMSPLMLANNIKKPLLLIHGEKDTNRATFPLQSKWFFDALKGNGVVCRLVLLPYESHEYSARESIMHLLWECDRWLQEFCVNSPDNAHDSKISGHIENVGGKKNVTASKGGDTTVANKIESAMRRRFNV